MRTSLFLASLLASYRASLSLAIFVEPPFTPGVTDNILNYSRLPSRVDELKLIAGINPTTLANFLGSVKNTENSQPNPIAESFPNSPTGTINGTYTILPIDYELARSIIPRRYGILKHSIREVLPGFPEGKYPLFLSTGIDHDIRQGSIGVPDFSTAQFRFPFVDLLGDGYSTFSYIPSLFISNNPIAIVGAAAYGEETIVGTFNPPKDPYALVPADKAKRAGEYFFNVARNGVSVLNTTYAPKTGSAGLVGAYPLSFYANVTNQPSFGCHSPTCVVLCDNLIRFFRTRITTGEFTPIGVEGSVSLAKSAISGISIFPNGLNFKSVYGVKLDVAFLENNFKDCNEYKGYEYEDEV